MQEIIVTTTNNVDGYVVIEYMKPITSSIVIGANILSDMLAGITDFVGGRSNTYQKKIQEMHNDAINELIENAKANKANCILGLKIDVDQISGKAMQMFMINAIGTPVKIQLIEEHIVNEENRKKEIELVRNEEQKRKNSFKSKEDLLKDPKILEEAAIMKKIYGEKAYERYIDSKIKEFNITVD